MSYFFKDFKDLIKDIKTYIDQEKIPSHVFLNNEEKKIFEKETAILKEQKSFSSTKIIASGNYFSSTSNKHLSSNKISLIQTSTKPTSTFNSANSINKPITEKKEVIFNTHKKIDPLPVSSLKEKQSLQKDTVLKKHKSFNEINSKSIKTEKKDTSYFVSLEQLSKPYVCFNETKKILKEISTISIVDQIPEDTKAKQISRAWKFKKNAAEITIFSFNNNPHQFLFLKNLALALNSTFLPTKVISAEEIEKEHSWDIFFAQKNLKLIIACDYHIWKFKSIVNYIKELPATKQYFIKDIPLFMLANIDLYLQEPTLKKSLWSTLVKQLKTI